MPVGSFTAWNTASNPTDRCPPIKPSVVATMRSTHSFLRLALGNTYPGLYTLIWNQLCAMRSEPELTANCITRNRSSREKRMLPITMLVVITLLEKRLWISYLIVSESWLITALVCKGFLSSTRLVVELALVLVPFFWNVSQLIMEGSPSFHLLLVPPRKLQRLLSSHITVCFQHMLCSSILIALSVWITRRYTMCAEEILTLNDQLIPISTV
mmetsp:Transcript_10038/g.14144  ORF Transcript_10038/g.14144 Transcript_10038/m.14144 type:complete len:213 (+) Transcript_10038:175-813(+)